MCRRSMVLATLGFLAAVVAAPGAVQAGGKMTGGIRGLAQAGPVAPVERAGEPNTRPLANALIVVQPARGGREIARRRTGPDGRFIIPLPPGVYLLTPLPPNPRALLPRAQRRTITIRPRQMTDVVIDYDTGIR
jgi:hypothetical protein